MERIVSWNGSQGAKQSTGKTGQSQMMWLEYAAVVEMERKWCLQERGWSWIDTSWMWEFREMEESRMTTQDSDLGGCLIQKIKRWVACIDFLREIFVAELLGDRNQVLGRSVWNSGEIWLVGRLVYCQLTHGPWSQGDRWSSPRRAKRLGEGRQSCTELTRTLEGPRVLRRLRGEQGHTPRGEEEYWSPSWWRKYLQKLTGARSGRDVKAKREQPGLSG